MKRLAILLSILVAAGAWAEEPALRWSGRVEFDRPLTVEAGQTLLVEPGTEIAAGPEGTVLVQGKVYLLGSGEAPVR
ncbi:MAG: hypothetical protein D6708_12200, partial [Candidatus Dadabacteria bacterium]